MEDPLIYSYSKTSSWNEAWSNTLFRKKAIGSIIFFITLLLFLPLFFSHIEARAGLILNDWLLARLPVHDSSVVIFIFVWSTSLLMIIRCIQQPDLFLMTLYLLIAITLTRILTISLFVFDPPQGLIPLKDPLTSLTYGGIQVFITKDLFFSGHTANLFMVYLCLQRKWDKLFALLATIMVGILLLIQHVHYTIDVIGAFVFTYILVRFVKQLPFFNNEPILEIK